MIFASAWPSNRSRAIARDKHGGGAGAGCLYRSANQQACKVAGERAPDRAEHEEAEPDQDRYLPAESVRQRSDNQLSEGKDREKNRDRRRDGALDTCRSAAMVASEGRKILVASIPVAANAQITAMAAVIDLPLRSVRTLP